MVPQLADDELLTLLSTVQRHPGTGETPAFRLVVCRNDWATTEDRFVVGRVPDDSTGAVQSPESTFRFSQSIVDADTFHRQPPSTLVGHVFEKERHKPKHDRHIVFGIEPEYPLAPRLSGLSLPSCFRRSRVPQAIRSGMMDGGQGDGAGYEPDRVNSVPPLQQRSALVFAWRLGAEEQLRVEEPERVGGSSGPRCRAGGRHDQWDPCAWPVPAGHEGTDRGRGVDRCDRCVVAAGAARSKGGPGEFTAGLGRG